MIRFLGGPITLALALTVALSSASLAANPLPPSILLSGYVPARQQHPLSCEAAATAMATRGILSEDMILARMPVNPDPNFGYRGNWNGQYIIPNLPN